MHDYKLKGAKVCIRDIDSGLRVNKSLIWVDDSPEETGIRRRRFSSKAMTGSSARSKHPVCVEEEGQGFLLVLNGHS